MMIRPYLVFPLDPVGHAHAVPADPVHGGRPVIRLHHLPGELASTGLDLVPGVFPVSAPEVVCQLHPGVPPGLGILALGVKLGRNSAVGEEGAGVVRFGRHLRLDKVKCSRNSDLGLFIVKLL